MDNTFNPASFPDMTTHRLIEAAADPKTDATKVGAIRQEIDRRKKVAQGDTSVMTESERMHFYRMARSMGFWKP